MNFILGIYLILADKCESKNLDLSIHDRIFVLQNQRFVLKSLMVDQTKKSEFIMDHGRLSQLEIAVEQLETDLFVEKQRLSKIFTKSYKYYM